MGTPIPADPGVYISPAQTYQEVRDLARTVDRIEAKLDGILDDNKDLKADVQDHETRIRGLEQTVWRAFGGAAVLGGAAGVVAQLLIR